MLSDLELCILSTKAMHFTGEEAIAHLKKHGHDIPLSTYYRMLENISFEARKRAYHIAKNFLEEHINTIDELEKMKKEMYADVKAESSPFNRVKMRATIAETMLPYISTYREATKKIIQEVKKEIDNQEKDLNISTARS